MRRTIAAALLFCAGCASPGSDPGDKPLWDISSLFSANYNPDVATVPRSKGYVPYSPPETSGSTAATPAIPASGS